MISTVAVTQSINCAHQLDTTDLHGHTYRVTVEHTGDVAPDGMVLHFNALRHHLGQVLAAVDHQQLENIIGTPATAERLARWVMVSLGARGIGIASVRIEVGDDGYVRVAR